MKKNSIRPQVVSLLVMAALILPSALMAQVSKTDFTGNWTYNASKSDAGQAQGQGQRPGGQDRGGFGGGDFIATQNGNILTVDKTMSTPDGTTNAVTTKYNLDGKESVNTSRMGDSKSVVTWSSDGKKLTIKTTHTMNMNGESRTITTTEVWSLPDSNTLQVEATMPSPDGERKVKSVYNKK